MFTAVDFSVVGNARIAKLHVRELPGENHRVSHVVSFNRNWCAHDAHTSCKPPNSQQRPAARDVAPPKVLTFKFPFVGVSCH